MKSLIVLIAFTTYLCSVVITDHTTDEDLLVIFNSTTYHNIE